MSSVAKKTVVPPSSLSSSKGEKKVTKAIEELIARQNLVLYFRDTTVDKVLKKTWRGDYYFLKPDETIKEALETMSERTLFACPIVKDGRCVGLIHTTDIISHLAHKIKAECQSLLESHIHSMADRQLLNEKLENISFEFLSTPVKYVKDLRHNRFRFLTTPEAETDTIPLPLSALSTYMCKNVHYVAILSEASHAVRGIVSQGDVLRHLYNEENEWAVVCEILKGHRLADLMTPVQSIGPTHNALEAILALAKMGSTSVAVTDTAGLYMGTVESSDLTMLQSLSDLEMSVCEFVDYTDFLSNETENYGQSIIKHNHTSVVQKDDPPEEVLEDMLRHHLHRVYVVDGLGDNARRMPIGVITLSDIFKMLFGEEKETPLHRPQAERT
eukprot:GCRY01001438.1.p1 GENE.GCRY01001438.1~~GCRY01001438.1.p1  ORF type:complete len:386 (-),score=112.98 GCRY01001438.1:240-1397(-)